MLFSFSFYLFLYISYYDMIFIFIIFLPLGTEKHGWPDDAVIV